jgi:uncharacterized membrane protein YkoI
MAGTITCAARIVPAALLALACVLTLATLRAQEVTQTVAQDVVQDVPRDAAHPAPAAAGYVCLDQKERRAEAESGRLIRLAAAMHAAKSRMPGTVVRARLCQGPDDGLVYVLTVLAHDGKVARITVDAANGTLVGEP